MKKIIMFMFLFGIINNPIISQNVYYLINDNLDKTEYINYDNKTINFDTKRLSFDFSFNGNSFEDLTVGTKHFYLVKGNDNSHLILDNYGKGEFSKIRIVKGDYDLVKKEILKKKLGNKTQILNSLFPKEGKYEVEELKFLSESLYNYEKQNYEYEIKREKERKKREEDKKRYIENYNSQTKLKDYIGTYKVKFLNHSGYKVSSEGTIYVTDVGVSIKCEDIISLNLLRSSHNKSFPKSSGWDEGSFYCKITKGYGEDLMISINKESKSVGFTTGSGRTSKTTSGTIINFIP